MPMRESHARYPLHQPPLAGEESFESHWRDFHVKKPQFKLLR